MFSRIWERSNLKIVYTRLKIRQETILELSSSALVLILLHTSLHVDVPIVSSHMLPGYEYMTWVITYYNILIQTQETILDPKFTNVLEILRRGNYQD